MEQVKLLYLNSSTKLLLKIKNHQLNQAQLKILAYHFEESILKTMPFSVADDELTAEGDQAAVSLEKGDRVLVFFECGPGQAQCENGGHGPAISYRPNLHPICTCLCPSSYNSPRCQFPSEQIEIVTS